MKKLLAALLLLCASSVLAQQRAPYYPELTRALNLVEAGDTTAARKVLDSLSTDGDPLPVRGEALYQLAQIAPSDAERERILGLLVIDQPFSTRLPAALLELGTLEVARNDRDRAITHLRRYLSASAPPDSNRLTTSLTLGRLLLERGDLARGCAVLLVGRAELPSTAIELRNQFEFFVGRCRGVDTTTKIEQKPAVDTTPAPRRTGAFTVQVAAYETKASAERLAKTLRGMGFEARVVGSAKPFRVRVGRYATRSEAEEASREVDRKAKTKSIVQVVGPEER